MYKKPVLFSDKPHNNTRRVLFAVYEQFLQESETQTRSNS